MVLASRAGDDELDELTSVLGKIGIGTLRLTAETVSRQPLSLDPAAGILGVGDRRLRPTVTWVRHFDEHAVDPGFKGAVGKFTQESWHSFVGQISDISNISITSRQPGILRQLAICDKTSIEHPKTMVVSDFQTARSCVGSCRVVLKSIGNHFVEPSPGHLIGIFPEIVERAEIDQLLGRPHIPFIVQEFVDHEMEMRVYFVHGDIYGFAVQKDFPAAPWIAPELVRARLIQVPEQVQEAVRKIACEFDLLYGAFDFLITRSGPVFLEVNVTGDWTWLESRADTRVVTMAVARMIRDLHDVKPTGAESRDRALDLLRFLAP